MKLFIFLFLFSVYLEAKPNRRLVYRPKPQPYYTDNYAHTPQAPTYTGSYSPRGASLANTQLVAKTNLPSDDTAPARFRFAPLLGVQNSLTGYGGVGEIQFSTGAPFFIGVQSGFLRFDGLNANTEEDFVSLIPVMATFLYRFNLKSGSVHPYLGVGIGVTLANGLLEEDGTITPVETTQTDLMVAGRPGVEFQLSRVTSFYLEPQIGLMQNRFVFLPQAGFAFDF